MVSMVRIMVRIMWRVHNATACLLYALYVLYVLHEKYLNMLCVYVCKAR